MDVVTVCIDGHQIILTVVHNNSKPRLNKEFLMFTMKFKLIKRHYKKKLAHMAAYDEDYLDYQNVGINIVSKLAIWIKKTYPQYNFNKVYNTKTKTISFLLIRV